MDNKKQIVPVILSGGSGSRLWPLSRELYPKQLHRLVGDLTMLQDTIRRLDGVPELQQPIVICNDEHRFMVAEQLRELGIEEPRIYLETVGRNTAPAVAIGALAALTQYEDPVLLVLPADHLIGNEKAFHVSIATAQKAATDNKLVTFGIVPDHAASGFGYIKKGDALDAQKDLFKVDQFVEKPDEERAKKFLDTGNYFWNSGMFMFRAQRYLDELAKTEPDMLRICQESLETVDHDLWFCRIQEPFEECPADSIDYAVMEKTEDAVMTPLDAEWSDLGSWSALWDVEEHDENGNVTRGDVEIVDVSNSYISSSGRLIAAVGMDDTVIVESRDAVLVAPKSRAQDIKHLVDALKKANRSEVSLHKKVYRPWGSYEGIFQGDKFQAKHIYVAPGQRISLQLHHQRSEHWIIVEGWAKVTRDEEMFILKENMSAYIPVGTKHMLENIGDGPLELIEVQTGSYFGEDDIVRFKDKYGRS